jgi:hypothetical protein
VHDINHGGGPWHLELYNARAGAGRTSTRSLQAPDMEQPVNT